MYKIKITLKRLTTIVFKAYLHCVACNKTVHETIGATNWGIKTALTSQTPSLRTGHRR